MDRARDSRCGDGSGAVHPEGQEDRIGSFFNGSFACDDVQYSYEQLRKRGVEFEEEPQKQPWGTYAIFKDPDGNRFVLSSK